MKCAGPHKYRECPKPKNASTAMDHMQKTSEDVQRNLSTEGPFQKLLKMPRLTQQSSPRLKCPQLLQSNQIQILPPNLSQDPFNFLKMRTPQPKKFSSNIFLK
ncbi:hypothetical protein AVEN_226088-1 [Araneus ventricosus]|uniref:Uncharacterized protein n=1 Tax=Araneus ventricosus TaxID=182803 RepID=A0A4Y2M531_ARAVE|nr:hypothetical protein AVEN_226088-1 [Araneus ventricosus]